jgi:hypothetical protein
LRRLPPRPLGPDRRGNKSCRNRSDGCGFHAIR